jgi:Fe-S cluster assembly ATP-binding protein
MLEIKNLKIAINKEISIEDKNSIFNVENILIQDASLTLKEGEIIKLEGANGSGKTTLLSAIFKNPSYKIVDGDIILDNKSVLDLDTHELARLSMYLGLQFIPEISGLSTIKFLYKAYENINKDLEKSKLINIVDFKKELEIKCDMFALDKNFLAKDLNVGYSGGEKKQATLIYILALMPKYLFLDEPDSGVDKESVEKIYKVINYMRDQGSAILITSHNTVIDKHINFDEVYKIENKKIC